MCCGVNESVQPSPSHESLVQRLFEVLMISAGLVAAASLPRPDRNTCSIVLIETPVLIDTPVLIFLIKTAVLNQTPVQFPPTHTLQESLL